MFEHENCKSDLVSYIAMIAAISAMASYSLGFGPLPWVLISELIPSRARATVGGIAVFLTWGLSFIVTKSFAPLKEAMGGAYGCFWLFAVFSIFTLIYIVTLLPETKGRTLEEIEYYFKEGKFPEKSFRPKITITSRAI
jgi:MFS family permease